MVSKYFENRRVRFSFLAEVLTIKILIPNTQKSKFVIGTNARCRLKPPIPNFSPLNHIEAHIRM